MRNKKLLILAACAAALLIGCGGSWLRKNPAELDSRRKTTFRYFGTVCFASVYDDFTSSAAMNRFDSAWLEITDMLARLDASANLDKPDSDIRRFNEARAGESVQISPMTADIMAEAIKLYDFTGGAFNPAVANLVDLWGFSPRFRNADGRAMPYDRPKREDGSFDIPDKRYIEAFQALSDFSRVKLTGDAQRGYYLKKDAKDIVVDGSPYSLKIDLGGIAKGYGAEKAGAILKAHGYEYGYVNLGMSSMRLLKRNVSDTGAPPGHLWAVNVSNPDNPSSAFLNLFGKDTGVSTSGTYDLRYSIGQRVYSHIIDVATGEPTQSDVMSVTVMGPDAGSADALSTALCVMGSSKASDFMKSSLKDYKVAMIVRATSGELELLTNIPREGYSLEKKLP